MELNRDTLDYFINKVTELLSENAKLEYKLKKTVNEYRELKGQNITLHSRIETLNYKLDHNQQENKRLHEANENLRNKIEELKHND